MIFSGTGTSLASVKRCQSTNGLKMSDTHNMPLEICVQQDLQNEVVRKVFKVQSQ